MGSLRTAQRKLKEKNVWIAQETEKQKIKFFQRLVEEKVKKDAEFAKDVLAAVGENLPEEIKKAAEETVAKENLKEREPNLAEADAFADKLWQPTSTEKEAVAESCEKSDQHDIT